MEQVHPLQGLDGTVLCVCLVDDIIDYWFVMMLFSSKSILIFYNNFLQSLY